MSATQFFPLLDQYREVGLKNQVGLKTYDAKKAIQLCEFDRILDF